MNMLINIFIIIGVIILLYNEVQCDIVVLSTCLTIVKTMILGIHPVYNFFSNSSFMPPTIMS